MDVPPPFHLTSVRRPEPAFHGPVPARSAGLSLFRFEGAALRVRSLVTSLSAFRCCLSGASRAQLLVRRSAARPAGDRSPRACPGRAAVLGGFPLAYSGSLDRDVRPCVRADEPLENSKASTSIFVLQATKSQRRMPWRLKPKKDVGDCEKPREAVYQASIRGCPNGATQHLS